MQDAGVLPDDPALGKLLEQAKDIQEKLDDEKADREELKAQLTTVKSAIDDWQTAQNRAAEKAALNAEIQSMVNGALAQTRSESKAHLIGNPVPQSETSTDHFFATLALARSRNLAEGPEAQIEAKARLNEMGAYWAGVPSESKATVGDTDAAGGYIVPNNVVSAINLQATPGRAVVDLFTVIDDVRGSAVDIPFEDVNTSLSRAVIAAAGATKENKNLVVNNYTATLYTLARIFDIGNQLLRQSQGAAERLVRLSIARAFALGED